MSDKPVSKFPGSESAAEESTPLSGGAMDPAALDRALRNAPQPHIPEGFAARVAAALPPAAPARARRDVASGAALGGAIVMLVALFVLAPLSTPSLANFGFDMELLLLAQLAAIAAWLATRHTT